MLIMRIFKHLQIVFMMDSSTLLAFLAEEPKSNTQSVQGQHEPIRQVKRTSARVCAIQAVVLVGTASI